MSTRRIAELTAPKGHCRGCQQPVPKGRRTWCSDACVQKHLIKLSPAVARARVERRDKGVCAGCGFDTAQASRVLQYLRTRGAWDYQRKRGTYPDDTYHDAWLWLANHLVRPSRPIVFAYHLPHLWEADHIVPVVEGGGSCELDNYRTLCRACHRDATRALRARMSERRRERIKAERLARWSGTTSGASA